jgi:hypothetical protein
VASSLDPQSYRSISPKTISIVPISVAKSAIKPPFNILDKICKLKKLGERILQEKGLLEPSDTKLTLYKPLGDSIIAIVVLLLTRKPECHNKK